MAFPSLEALKNHKKRVNNKNQFVLLQFLFILKTVFYSILTILGSFWAHFWTILANMVHFGSKIEDAHCAFPSLEAFFTRSKLNESAFY